MKKEAYLIKVKGSDNLFLHPLGEDNQNITYVVKEGITGAAIWTLDSAIDFIKRGKEDLEKIDLFTLIKQ